MAVIFNKISLNGAKLDQKKVKTFHFGDHIRTWTVISKKKSSPCFLISVRAAASTVFPNLAFRVKSLPTPALEGFGGMLARKIMKIYML